MIKSRQCRLFYYVYIGSEPCYIVVMYVVYVSSTRNPIGYFLTQAGAKNYMRLLGYSGLYMQKEKNRD